MGLTIPYEPRTFQAQFHEGMSGKLFGLFICARQHGKTHLATAEVVDRAVRGPDNTSYGYAAPYAHMARRIFWPRLKEFLRPFRDLVVFRETDQVAILPGNRRIYSFGLDNESCRGLSLAGVIIDEFDDVDTEVYQSALLPTMASYERPFTIFIGTLKRYGKLWQLYLDRKDDPEWYCQITKATDVGVMNEDQLDRFRLEMGESAFAREFMCDPNAPTGNSVLGELMAAAANDGRIRDIPVNPALPVHTAWDLGIRDHTAIWGFQLSGDFVYVTHYWEFSGIGLNQALSRLKQDRGIPEWGYAILPHDIAVRDLMSGVSRLDVFKKMYPGKVQPLGKVPIADTLSASRINVQRCIFDQGRTDKGINRLRNAAYRIEPKTGTITDTIIHDDNSHGLDAFRALSTWLESKAPSMSRRRNTETLYGGAFERLTRRNTGSHVPRVKRA